MLYLLDSRVEDITLVKCYKFSLLDLSKISNSGSSDVFFSIEENGNSVKITDFLRITGVKFQVINNIPGIPNNNIVYQLDPLEVIDFNSDQKLQEKLNIGKVESQPSVEDESTKVDNSEEVDIKFGDIENEEED